MVKKDKMTFMRERFAERVESLILSFYTLGAPASIRFGVDEWGRRCWRVFAGGEDLPCGAATQEFKTFLEAYQFLKEKYEIIKQNDKQK